MATFIWTPSFEATESSKPRVKKFQAGDGYEQRITFGMPGHNDPKEWGLTFSERTNTERDSILAFLEARAAVESFDWTPPRGTAGKYVCEEWQVSMRHYNFNTIQATFRQVFEP